MSPETLDLVLQGLRLTASLAAPVVLAALLAGLISSAFAGLLAWHDAAISQVPRLLAVVLAWALAAPWIATELLSFAKLCWST